MSETILHDDGRIELNEEALRGIEGVDHLRPIAEALGHGEGDLIKVGDAWDNA